MNFKPPPPSSPLPTNSNPLPLTHTLTLHWVSPPPFPSAISKPTRPFRLHANPAADLTLTTAAAADEPPISNEDQKLLILLRQRKTEEAWILYTQSSRLPNPTCLSHLLFQLSDQNTRSSLNERQLRQLPRPPRCSQGRSDPLRHLHRQVHAPLRLPPPRQGMDPGASSSAALLLSTKCLSQVPSRMCLVTM